MIGLRRIMIVLVTLAMLSATGVARGAHTTNFSDQWWIERESGWGASVLQQADILFIDLFVYGADDKPVWFTAAASHQAGSAAGHVVFVGDLFQTSGPYFGGPFNPAAVGYTKVGTLTFDADTVNTARLSYTVNGVPVVKDVTRQLWRYDDLGGNYYGGFAWDQPCEDGTDNDHFEILGSLRFSHFADNAVRIDLDVSSITANGVPQPVPANAAGTITGTYTQSGHVGQIQGTFTFTSGQDSGTLAWNLFEIERSINGISGRFSGAAPDTPCRVVRRYDGRFGGVRR